MSGDEAARLEKLLDDGWSYHDTESERLARELEAAAAHDVASNVLAPFLHLATHTIGEHLDDWPRALRLGKRVITGQTPSPDTARAWGRLYVAAVLAGESVEAVDLELTTLKAAGDDVGTTLLDMRFMLIAGLVGSKRADEAAHLYRSALDLVGQIPPSAQLHRTIAVASNNLGWELYEARARTAGNDALMRLCAETSLAFWLKCGNWINAERAHYLNAVVANVSGDPTSGLAHADAALAIVAANGERPLDAALLQLARATSLGALGDVKGQACAMADADAAAEKLVAKDLKAQFLAERSRVLAAAP